MKQILKKGFMLATLFVLSSCDKGGSNDNKQAQVPAPLERIQAHDAVSYCELSGTSILCYSTNILSQACNSTTKSYTDTLTLCQSLDQIRNEIYNSQNICDVSNAVNAVYNKYSCLNVISGQQNVGLNPGIPQLPVITDPNMKTVRCEFEAFRIKQHGGWLRINQVSQTPKTTATMIFDGRMAQTFNLRNYFIFDVGHFGTLKMNFTPTRTKGTSDTITISSKGFKNQNGDVMEMNQSGFAGQPVKLETTSSDGQVKLSISCAGQSSLFKKSAATLNFSKYVCRGTSSLDGTRRENVEIELPYNSNLLNTEISLAENLTAVVTGGANGADNARITFTAEGIGINTALVSSAYLKTTSQLNATDGLTTLNLTCGPQ